MVGLVYNVEEMSWKEVQAVIKYFESYGKSVTTLGFFNEKELTHEYNPNYKHLFFCRQQLSFWGLPMPHTMERFLDTEFDYLINFDLRGQRVLQAISAYSRAMTRIGKYLPDYDFAQDLMVQVDASDGPSFFEHIKKYLKHE